MRHQSKALRLRAVAIALSLFALSDACTNVAIGAPLPDNVVQAAAKWVAELKTPDYAISRCMLSPDLATDNVTVAISVDRVFSMGDVFLEIAGQPLDASAKTPIRDILVKHGPNEELSVKIRRGGDEMIVSAKCTDAKPFNDLLLEGFYAASKQDASGCADKLEAAAQLKILSAWPNFVLYECRYAAERIPPASAAQGYYDVARRFILEARTSADALAQIRGNMLGAVNDLRNANASFLADDLQKQYDEAVAAANRK